MHILNKLSEDYKLHTKNVSLAKLFALLDINPTPMQDGLIDLWDNSLTEFSEVNIAASRRQGKTFSGAILIIRELLIVNSSTMVVSKSAKSVGVLFNEVLRMLRVLGLKPTKVNSNQYSLQLNDSILRCTVHRTMDTLLGNKASLIVLDECGTYSYSDDVNINLLPMRNDYSTYADTNMFVSKVLRISSPREIGSDFYYDWVKGNIKRPSSISKTEVYVAPKGVVSMTFSIYDSPLATPELIEAVKETTEEEKWQTEYLCNFIHMNSISAFSMYNEKSNTFKLPELIKRIGKGSLASLGFHNLESTEGARLQGFLGLDVGFRDNSAIVVCTVIDNCIYVLDAYEQAHMTSKEFAEGIQQIIQKWQLGDMPLDFTEGAIYIDKTAAMMSADLNVNYDIPALPGYNKVREGISLMNTGFKTNKLYINEDLTFLTDQITMLAFKEAMITSINKSSGDPFIRVKGHHFDVVHALRYVVTSMMMYWGIATDIEDIY